MKKTVKDDLSKKNLLLDLDVVFDSDSTNCILSSLAQPGGEAKNNFYTKWRHK